MHREDTSPVDVDSARFEHDCDRCVWLGRDGEHDVYVCRQGGWPTVILRYGDDGPEYHSGAHLVDRFPNPMRDKAASLMADWRATSDPLES